MSLLNKKRGCCEKIIRKLKKITSKLFGHEKLEIIEANELYSLMMENKSIYEGFIRGAFFSWDNTPRHGKRGYIINEVSKERFFEYMNSIKENEFISKMICYL